LPKDQNLDLPIISSDLVFGGRIWDVVSETFDFDNQKLTREFIRHPGAVAVVAIDDQQRVLMIRQYRHPVRKQLWELPAGLLDIKGETKSRAAERELMEETGYRAGHLEPLINFYTTPGGNSEQISIFLATELEYIGHKEELEGEETQLVVDWIPVLSALDSVLKSEVMSPTAMVGIMALALKLGIQTSVE
jgi:ADP-ribose pyrophosphatase